MVHEELLTACKIALDDMQLKTSIEGLDEAVGGGHAIRFFNERGHELCVYIKVPEGVSRLLECEAFFYDFSEERIRTGDVFRFERNLESCKIDSYARIANILWANKYASKPPMPEGVREFRDSDLLALIREVERRNVSYELQVVSDRPRLSFKLNGEEIASARKSAGKLRYQSRAGDVIACKSEEPGDLRDFLEIVLKDLGTEVSEKIIQKLAN
jgi:hypothetical protein